MSSNDRIRNSRRFRSPMLIIGITMTSVFVVMGCLLLFVKGFLPEVTGPSRNIFGGVLIIYGVYRGWRVYDDHYKN